MSHVLGSAVRHGDALALQRTAGNAAVAQLMTSGMPPPIIVQRQATQVTRRGPQIVPGDGTTAELLAERDRLISEQRTMHVSAIEPETEMRHNGYVMSIDRLELLLAERGSSSLPEADFELTFDGTTLATSVGLSWPAVSGRRDESGRFDYLPSRQRIANVGPIPAGTYWLDPAQLVNLSNRWFYSWRYETAWGTDRITIHPLDATRTFGRGGFFIHGGTSAGSAGCVDLTSGMASFARMIGALPGRAHVKLYVQYPTW